MITRMFTLALLVAVLVATLTAQVNPPKQVVQVAKLDLDQLRSLGVPIVPGNATIIQCWVYERGDDQRKYTLSFRYQDKDGVHAIMQVVPAAPWGTVAIFTFPTLKATDMKMLSISVAYGDSQQPTTASEQTIEDNNHVGVQ